MPTRIRLGTLLAVATTLAVCWRFGFALESAQNEAARSLVTADLLGGADRYLTHVSTDKPIYRRGEKLYVRGVVLHQQTNKPLMENVSAAVEILGPKGDIVASGQAGLAHGPSQR